ncbi:hypothetical protein SeLEV6574_g01468 [Synchytrium endobioticum]|uniref:Uncharacterized protein n=1 Tax=Synchytrium endobioticum TaxID=286115 RepID=A0A507DDX4_9FUNG|nr:hypothetical protein SeLEV6574_g01468 [Synchytrium endobioticum]
MTERSLSLPRHHRTATDLSASIASASSTSPSLSKKPSLLYNVSTTNMNASQPSPPSTVFPGFNRAHSLPNVHQAPTNTWSNNAPPALTQAELLWRSISANVIPLYNGEGVKGNLEDINDHVRQWATDMSSQTLLDDMDRLFRGGMSILSTKLVSISDESLPQRVVEIWTFHFGTVLPYLQAVFLPVRGILNARLSDTRVATTSTTAIPNVPAESVADVRTMALVAFRDVIVDAHAARLQEAFPSLFKPSDADPKRVKDIVSRALQMCSILGALPVNDEKQRLLSKTMQQMLRLVRSRMMETGMLASPAPLTLTRARSLARAPRPCWVRTDGRLVRVDDMSDAHIAEERRRHPANRMEAYGDQEAIHAGDAAGSRPRRRPRAGCVRRTATSPNRSTALKKRPATRTTTTRTRPSTPPPPPPPPISPSPPTLPTLPQTPPLRLLPWEMPVQHPPPPFLVPEPTNLDFRFTDAEANAYANAGDETKDLACLSVDLREAANVCVDNVASMLGPLASAECLRLTASITYRCLIQAPIQEFRELVDISVGAAAVALAYDDKSVDAVRALAYHTAWDAAVIGQLQRQVLKDIGYSVEHL